jgi:murein DD-endopeptidase MepM/ murein hydrolase activator NlpD
MKNSATQWLTEQKWQEVVGIPPFLCSQPFLRQSHSQAESTFADVRNYIYQGKKIDQRVHLGYDLAVTQHVGVQASNDGKVVYAAPLGIYGNCILVDH